jgi:hypothetical protein
MPLSVIADGQTIDPLSRESNQFNREGSLRIRRKKTLIQLGTKAAWRSFPPQAIVLEGERR